MAKDLYRALGLSRGASADEIKKAFRKLARECHPDLHPDDKAAVERFKEINQAHDVLSDPEKRQMYDELGETAEKLGYDPEKYRQYKASGGGAAGFGGFGFGGDGVDMEDLLGNLFGQRRGPRGPRPGRDRQTRITIDFTTAALGGERSLHIADRAVQMRIPAGIRPGGKLRLKGHGEPSPNGGPAGDLLVEVDVAPDPLFSRAEDDLLIEVPITLGEALRGGSIEVPTLGAPVRVRVPVGTQPGQKLRVKGRGIQRKDQAAGDLLVTLKLVLPDVKDAPNTAEAAIVELEKLYGDVRADLRARMPAA
jgi:curved DNA-binding protein